MANSPSSKKRALQAERRADVNKARRSRMRTFIRKVEEAIAAGEPAPPPRRCALAQPEIMRSVSRGRACTRTPPAARSRAWPAA